MRDIYQTAISILNENGVRASRPRVAIYAFLLENRIHPSAETIYHALLPHYQSLSLTTVYNTLRLFAKYHLVTPLTIEDGELRYDINTEFHVHFKCRCCGSVIDIPVQDYPVLKPLPDMTVEAVNINCYGLCRKCSVK